MTNANIEFAISYKFKNRYIFEDTVVKANEVWSEAFGKKYNYGECPGDAVIIGCIDGTPVCSAIIDIHYNYTTALISCIASNPKNNGYGTLLMKYIIDYFDKINIYNININVNIDKNSDRLIKFYSKFGFVVEDSDNEDYSVYEYDTRIEFRMILDTRIDDSDDKDNSVYENDIRIERIKFKPILHTRIIDCLKIILVLLIQYKFLEYLLN